MENLGLERATALSRLPLANLQREYPHHLLHVLRNAGDIGSPRDLHPAFYGSFDWHSCVHGHWMLVRLLRLFELPDESTIREVLADNLTKENLRVESDYLRDRPTFERAYGWAWLLALAAELRSWDDAAAAEWAGYLGPLEDLIVRLWTGFLERQTYPIRVGTHGNTAFSLGLAFDYAVAVGNQKFEQLIRNRSRDYYLEDRNAPVQFEPGGNDFLSPTLIEADLMRRILGPGEFRPWLAGFIPDFGALLTPAVVSDRSDPQIGHLDGLNLSRAWCLRSISHALNRREDLEHAASEHARVGLEGVFSGHYEGEHWLASFAVYLLS